MNFPFIQKVPSYRMKDIGEVENMETEAEHTATCAYEPEYMNWLREYKNRLYRDIEWETDRMNRINRDIYSMKRIAVRQLFEKMKRKEVPMIEYK